MKDSKKIKFAVKVGSLATALAVTAVTGFAYTSPSTYVSLDINPSIEYSVNAFDRVIKVVAVNEDGEKIVNELDLRNDKIEKAIEKTIEKLKEEGYITNDDYSGIVIAVSNKNKEKSDELSEDLEEKLDNDEEEKDDEENELEAEDKEEDKEEKVEDEDEASEEINVAITVESVGRERVEEARKLGVTPGKLNLVQKLIASTDEFDEIDEEKLQELLSLSVKEISKMTNENKREAKFGKIEVEDKDYEDDDFEEDEEIEETEKEEVQKNEKNEKSKDSSKPVKEEKIKDKENKGKKNN